MIHLSRDVLAGIGHVTVSGALLDSVAGEMIAVLDGRTPETADVFNVAPGVNRRLFDAIETARRRWGPYNYDGADPVLSLVDRLGTWYGDVHAIGKERNRTVHDVVVEVDADYISLGYTRVDPAGSLRVVTVQELDDLGRQISAVVWRGRRLLGELRQQVAGA